MLNRPSPLKPRIEFCDNGAFMKSNLRRLTVDASVGDPRDSDTMLRLLRLLFEAGQHDLALGRLLEGHIDACQIIARYGPPGLEFSSPDHFPLCGVWNAEGPGHHLVVEDGCLTGGKSFASGAGILTHALVTTCAGTAAVQLYLIDLAKTPPEIDRDWWQVSGMQASETHRVSWPAVPLDEIITIGGPGDYERLPWFATGALRFVTVQTGGIAGLYRSVARALRTSGKQLDPIQKTRLAKLFGISTSAVAVCKATAEKVLENDNAALWVSNARNEIYDFAEEAIAIAGRAVGTGSMFTGSDVNRFVTDLSMYVRQPGPDTQVEHVGAAAGADKLKIAF